MRVLVTGGSGFVGSNVVEVLPRHDAEVVAPGHAWSSSRRPAHTVDLAGAYFVEL